MITLGYSNFQNNCDTGYVESANSSQESCVPELFYYNSSTQQAAYFFESVILDGLPLNENDWVGAFNGDICVGARKWDIDDCNGICDVPVLGQDSQLTSGYMQQGDTPSFKIFKASSLSYLDATPIENISWSNFSTPVINLLYACDESNCEPDCLGVFGGLAVQDCAGDCDGNALVDCKGECNGTAEFDCLGECDGIAILDLCGVCNGDNSTCLDCMGVPNGNALVDCEGVCNGMASDCDQLNASIVNDFVVVDTYPNPFNPDINIEFSLPVNDNVSILIYNAYGEVIKKVLDNKYLYENTYKFNWDGKDNAGNQVPSGVYFINLTINKGFSTRKVTLIK